MTSSRPATPSSIVSRWRITPSCRWGSGTAWHPFSCKGWATRNTSWRNIATRPEQSRRQMENRRASIGTRRCSIPCPPTCFRRKCSTNEIRTIDLVLRAKCRVSNHWSQAEAHDCENFSEPRNCWLIIGTSPCLSRLSFFHGSLSRGFRLHSCRWRQLTYDPCYEKCVYLMWNEKRRRRKT